MSASIIIIDDEPAARKVLEQHISGISYLNLLATFSDAVAAFDFLLENQVDIILLDIEMPKLSGLELAKHIPKETAIIYTTAYSNYALTSFDLGAIDYLVKPISLSRFLKAIQKSVRYTGAKLHQETTNIPPFTLKIDGSHQNIEISQVCYIQSFGNYLKVFTQTDMFLVVETMQNAEKGLEKDGFLRVHRSFLVNTIFIRHFDGKLHLMNSTTLPVGQLYKKGLLHFLGQKNNP